jgi:hypothetical protein
MEDNRKDGERNRSSGVWAIPRASPRQRPADVIYVPYHTAVLSAPINACSMLHLQLEVMTTLSEL